MRRRILSLLLCVCMLASTAVLFSSCGKKTLDFANGYKVVYGESLSQSISKEINSLATALKDKTGTEVSTKKVKADDEVLYNVVHKVNQWSGATIELKLPKKE